MTALAPIGKGRLEALSDGVYAVSLTLLVLELRLPPLADASDAALVAALVALAPKALVWMLSFWVGALFWLAQSRVLSHYQRLDRGVLLAELAQLALIALLPFSSALIGEHGDRVGAALVYSAHLALLASLSLLRVARLVREPSLQCGAFDAAGARSQLDAAYLVLACTLVAVGLAFLVPGWNMLALLGLLLRRPLAWARAHKR